MKKRRRGWKKQRKTKERCNDDKEGNEAEDSDGNDDSD